MLPQGECPRHTFSRVGGVKQDIITSHSQTFGFSLSFVSFLVPSSFSLSLSLILILSLSFVPSSFFRSSHHHTHIISVCRIWWKHQTLTICPARFNVIQKVTLGISQRAFKHRTGWT
eukprot:m.44167 g.44167  ORF g.44167 m.44167 type:complete len:117 (+) comp17221_c0_seq1:75-425(+)